MMGCCAFGTCTDPRCYLCTVVAKLPQPVWSQPKKKTPKSKATRDGMFDVVAHDQAKAKKPSARIT